MSSSPLFARAPILVATRYSFLGQSGWKSDASRDADLLFAPERLAQRLALFRAVTLPLLAAQTDPDFHHFILTSQALPAAARSALEAACLTAYGDPSRFSLVAARPGPARGHLRNFMSARWPGQAVAQVVIDDDDGLALDYIAHLRSELAALDVLPPEEAPGLPYFLSWSEGYGLSLRDADGGAALYRHRYPFINAGLAMLALAEEKNIFGIDHLGAPRRFGNRLINAPRMFLRSLHDFNDSRVSTTERWQKLEDWQAEPDLAARFPCLFAPDTPWHRP